MQDQINLLKFLKSDVFVFADVSDSIQGAAETPLSQRPELKLNEWKEYTKKLSEIANRLDDIGLPLSYHEHMGTIIESESDVEKFLDSTNNKTFLLYDTGYLLFAGADYTKILKTYISRINHVHLK